MLDVGSGIKPYAPFFEPYAESYVGVDIGNPAADLEGSADALPVEDGSFDLVLSTQVLEHVEDPYRRPGVPPRNVARRRVLASTHGVQVYHPSPTDYWRWTYAGLELLFERSADWGSVTVTPVAAPRPASRPRRPSTSTSLPPGHLTPLAPRRCGRSTPSARSSTGRYPRCASRSPAPFASTSTWSPTSPK